MEDRTKQMRVELIHNPELKGLTRRDIEIFRDEYKIYKEKVEQQGENINPVSKYACVPTKLRKSIGLQMGIKFSDLTPIHVWQKIDAIMNEAVVDSGIDPKLVFKGIKMVPPKRALDIKKRIQEYILKIGERISRNAIEDELYDPTKLTFRKQAFPNIIQGVWPEELATTISKTWTNGGKKWTLQELLFEIEEQVDAVGHYELDRLRLVQEKMEKKGATTYKRKDKGVSVLPSSGRFEKRSKYEPPRRPAANGQNDSNARDLNCFNCGGLGHRKYECKIRYNHPDAIKGRKESLKKQQRRLKKLHAFLDQAESDAGGESNSDGERNFSMDEKSEEEEGNDLI